MCLALQKEDGGEYSFSYSLHLSKNEISKTSFLVAGADVAPHSLVVAAVRVGGPPRAPLPSRVATSSGLSSCAKDHKAEFPSSYARCRSLRNTRKPT